MSHSTIVEIYLIILKAVGEDLPETEQSILSDGSIRLSMKLATKKIDGHRYVVIPAPGMERQKQTNFLRAIHNARRWTEMLMNGEAKNITDLAGQLGMKSPYVTRILNLNNLAPDIVKAIIAGNEPDGLSIEKVSRNLPEDWNEQRKLFGFPTRQTKNWRLRLKTGSPFCLSKLVFSNFYACIFIFR